MSESDERLRTLERKWRATGSVEDEAHFLAERTRKGQILTRVLLSAALMGSSAARLVNPDFSEVGTETLDSDDQQEVLRLLFGQENIPERAREFLTNLIRHDQEARATLEHYELVQKGDKAPPDTPTALKALTDHLRSNPNHLEAINQMQRAVFQLVPVYEPEGAGFQRMVNALDTHQREGQRDTYVRKQLRTRWRMISVSRGKIVGWQVAVTEGAKVLPRESNRFLERDGCIQRVEDQLNQWQQYCREQGLELCDNRSHALLQMQEIRLAPPGTPLVQQLGIDPENMTYLGDKTRQPESLVPNGSWGGDRVYFLASPPGSQFVDARFRPSVVVKKIL